MVDVTGVEALDGHKLLVSFNTGEQGVVDMTPYLGIGQFQALCDPSLFCRARVECFTVVWPGGIDIAPERLYEEAKEIRPVA